MKNRDPFGSRFEVVTSDNEVLLISKMAMDITIEGLFVNVVLYPVR